MVIDYLLILGFGLLPVFLKFPYRINLYLAWEGAYRISEGQVPFRDFGMPLGYGYWALPALFFKVLGPSVYHLLKVQALINIIGGIAFRNTLRLLKVSSAVTSLSVLVFILSFSMVNFWPWYNHSTIFYELIAIYFLVKSLMDRRIVFLFLSAFFCFFSFFTKQDGGGLCLMLCLALLAYDSFHEKSARFILYYIGFIIIIGLAFILPLLKYDFGYWFNYGQAPHFSRLTFIDILDEVLGKSQWEKFYLGTVLLLALYSWQKLKDTLADKPKGIFLLLTLGIIVQALIFQVTSYIPRDSNVFFHSFAFAFLAAAFFKRMSPGQVHFFISACMLIGLWWSGMYWNKFLKSRVEVFFPRSTDTINKSTFVIDPDTTKADRSDWMLSKYYTFKNIYLPQKTIEGISRLEQTVRQLPAPQPYVLNMSELTPLNYEFNLVADQGPYHSLWYHKGVGLFDREVEMFCSKVTNREYDLVLFQVIPNLNEFYPSEVRNCLKRHYVLQDKFLAPRIPENSTIEIYVRPQSP